MKNDPQAHEATLNLEATISPQSQVKGREVELLGIIEHIQNNAGTGKAVLLQEIRELRGKLREAEELNKLLMEVLSNGGED